ncbi:PREDICTED: uncharacterized protein LOC105144170 [Acromyrmex echinatior]|uniref:uncharacterized protein LOC105144170 n=1 Tax=Acromyrmex echinatior TaxID=103372 RepID=UPI000580D005|nr:PREDICTED: uncharacterized protein LOC105144170 [Acromyrmex echinatior]
MTAFKISQELAFTSAPKLASKSKDSISKFKESREGDIPEYEKSEIKPKETKDITIINSTLDKEEVPKKKVSTRRKSSTKSTEGSEDQEPVLKPKKKKPKSADESKVYNYMLIIYYHNYKHTKDECYISV